MTEIKEFLKELVIFPDCPPEEVWVVSNIYGCDFVTHIRSVAMEHAAESSETRPEACPFRVCKYVAADLQQEKESE